MCIVTNHRHASSWKICEHVQVYQLMMPHYHYTFQINAEARSGLINGGGLVEKVHPFRIA